MFLDDTHVWPGKDERPAPAPPRFRHEKALSRIALGYALCLLVLPVSAGGAADLIRYLLG